MSVSLTRTPAGTWQVDDPEAALTNARISSGVLEDVLTALTLTTYDPLAALTGHERAQLLRSAASMATSLTRQVRHLTVANRDIDGMTWGTLSSQLTGDPHQRSTARSTYTAGRRQLGLPDSPWPANPVADFPDEELADAIERHQDSSDPVT
ncbi:hypothetical protein ACFVXH_41470, partial [Kitasatospora sp. NPDC058184]|uniref:hypothetical protein n=1 Tax=Kitasatospora sp. NPDC058184 TaxID=3346370 RepID=UPI0036D967C3